MKTQAQNVGSVIKAVFAAVQNVNLDEVTEVKITDSISNTATVISIDLRRLIQNAIMIQLEEKQVLRGGHEEGAKWKNGIAANLESIECTTNGKTLVIATQRNKSDNDTYNNRMLNITDQFGSH